MPVFDYEFRVQAPLAAVAEFHSHTSALKKLMPPPVFVQFHHTEPLHEGSLSEFTLWFAPLPSRWSAVHFNVDPLRGFTDRQERGPLKSWQHTHRFTQETEQTCLIHEHIEYEHSRSAWGVFTRLFFSRPMLSIMFNYRQWVTRRALEKR